MGETGDAPTHLRRPRGTLPADGTLLSQLSLPLELGELGLLRDDLVSSLLHRLLHVDGDSDARRPREGLGSEDTMHRAVEVGQRDVSSG